jgi:hypothetical protein
MTMPHLMNCPHAADGWCLACVSELHAEKERMREVLADGHISPGHDECPEVQHPLSYSLECIAEDIAGDEIGESWGEFLKATAGRIRGVVPDPDNSVRRADAYLDQSKW